MKNRIIAALIACGSLGFAVTASPSPATEDVAKEIANLEQLWAQSEMANDVALEATYLADTLVDVGLDGSVNTKEQFLAEEKQTRYTKVDVGNLRVHAYGSTAVANYVLTMKGTDAAGKPMDIRATAMDTWVKMPNGKWQCVATVSSALKK